MSTTIKTTDVLAFFRDGIIADTDLDTFCQTNYSSDINIFTGIDPRHPLGMDDCPYVVISPIGGSEGEENRTITFSLELEFAIVDRVYADINSNGAKEMQGFFKLDELGYLIRQAIYNLSGSNIIADEVVYDLSDRTRYPHFIGYMTIVTAFTDPIGGAVGI